MNAPLSCPIDVLHVCTANPSFFVLRVLCDEETGYPLDIEKVPVLCWAIVRESYAAYPITPEGLHLESAYIQYPHGAVECVGVDVFSDASALLAYSAETGHLFRRKLDTRSSANWTRVPGQTGHCGRSDAGSKFGFYS